MEFCFKKQPHADHIEEPPLSELQECTEPKLVRYVSEETEATEATEATDYSGDTTIDFDQKDDLIEGEDLITDDLLTGSDILISQEKPLTSSESGLDSMGIVAHLNNTAVVCIKKGDLYEAELFLQKAITAASSKPKPLPVMVISDRVFETKSNNSNFSPSAEVSVNNGMENYVMMKSSPSLNSSRRKQMKYGRDQYDEGMSNTHEPLWMESTSLSPTGRHQMIATVLYNLGKLKTFQEDEREAEECFSTALANISLTSGVMEIHQEHHHERHQAIKLAILHGLGQVQYGLGRYEDALGSYTEALEIGREYLGSYHLDVAKTLNCMGVVNFHIPNKKPQEQSNARAMELYTEALTIRKAVLGHFHIDVATTLNNIGRVHYLNGDYVSAIEVYNRALQIRISLVGNDHLDVGATTYNLGQTHHQLGNFDTALAFYKDFLRIAQVKLGKNHRDIAVTIKCMAQIHHEEYRFDSALKLYEEALIITRVLVGNTNHVEIASILNKIGNLYYERNDFIGALKAYEEGLDIEREVYKDGINLNLVVTLTNIGQIHRRQGNYRKALKHFLEAHEIQQSTLTTTSNNRRSEKDKDRHKISDTLKNIALVFYQMGEYDRSFDVYQKILRLRRDVHGDIDIEVAATLNSIGMVLFKQGLMEPAMESFQECLRIRRHLLGNDHVDVAAVLFNVATLLYERGNEDEAMVYYRETLRVERAALGNDHADVVFTLQSLGQIHYQRGELDRALQYFNESLRVERSKQERNQYQQHPIRSTTNGDINTNIARTLNRIGTLHLQRGNTSSAMEAYTDALRLYRQEGYDDDKLSITGIQFYMLSKLHPECAAAA